MTQSTDRSGAATSDADRREEQAAADVPGGEAEKPTEIPARGWRDIAVRGWKEAKTDQVPLLGAGVAYYGFLALFPALIATIFIYGLAVKPATVQKQISQLGGALPDDAKSLLTSQLTRLTSTASGALSIGLIITVLLALWSASGGIGNLITAINLAYDEDETRGFVKRKALALGLTIAAIVFVIVIVALVAAAPAVLNSLVPSGPIRWLLEAARWVLIVLLFSAALAVLYRLAPDRDAPKVKWVSVGAVVATVIWIIASVGFSLYVNYFGNYAKTYGALAGVVVLLLWLWLSAYAVLLGAEINAESEQQTVRDTTRGDPQPLGERRAVKADSLPTDEVDDQKR